MTTIPTLEQVRSLPQYFDLEVPETAIDENGHMNISQYFHYGSWAPWKLMGDCGMGDAYIDERALSTFTVGHHIAYLGELRLGERFSVSAGLAARTAKALHTVAYVVDEQRDRIACALEVSYVHVSMETRRAVVFPDDIAARLDTEIARQPWVAQVATGLSLKR